MIDKNKKVGQYVAENIAFAHVFKKHNIDFCCGGGISVEKACEKANISTETLLVELQNVGQSPAENTDYRIFSPGVLCDIIVEKHHQYIYDNAPTLKAYADKVARVHGSEYPYLNDLKLLVMELCFELDMHLPKEEQILFPSIKSLKANQNDPTLLPKIKVMLMEHDQAGEIHHKIQSIRTTYPLPKAACASWRAFDHLLSEFLDDLIQHIHLENNILFEKLNPSEN